MSMLRGRSRTRLAVVAAVAVLIVAGVVATFGRSGGIDVTAHFTEVKGLYGGDSVTFLGVRIGKITSIQPERNDVVVTMHIDTSVTLPADARAAISAPALVAVRTLAVGPIYRGGPVLVDGAVIPVSRTAVPEEWDQTKTELTRLGRALGPSGANREGAVGRLVSASSRFLDGNGESINRTIGNLSEALSTLADNGGNIFATVRNLQVFVSALRGSDRQVRVFNTRLASVSSALASHRAVLSRALKGLRSAFLDVRAFLKNNGAITASTLHQLRSTTGVLAQDRQGLADILQLAPTAVSNFYNILDPRNGALTGVLALQNLNSPVQIMCAALLNLGGQPSSCESALGPLVRALALKNVPTGVVPPLALPGTTGTSSPGGATSKGKDTALDGTPGIDDLLSGLAPLLGGGR